MTTHEQEDFYITTKIKSSSLKNFTRIPLFVQIFKSQDEMEWNIHDKKEEGMFLDSTKNENVRLQNIFIGKKQRHSTHISKKK